jgi:Bacterial SH3 domain
VGRTLIVGLLALLACPAIAGAQAQAVKVTAERTSLRDKPATDAAVVATVMKGDDLDVLETSGTWYRVRARSSGREGFVHSAFVDKPTTASVNIPSPQPLRPQPTPAPQATSPSNNSTPSNNSAANPTAAAPNAQQPGGGLFQPRPPLGDRKFGVGLAGGGLAFGFTPSLRYWANDKTGFEVNASFLNSYGYSVTAISPSLVMRFKEPKRTGSVAFAPYFGGGITYWRFSNGYYDYYCDLSGVSCSRSSIGFGGFGGAEVLFDAVPKLAASASLGFYSSPSALGYGGLYLSVSAHYYFK